MQGKQLQLQQGRETEWACLQGGRSSWQGSGVATRKTRLAYGWQLTYGLAKFAKTSAATRASVDKTRDIGARTDRQRRR